MKQKYKVVIGIKEGMFSKSVDEPVYFDDLEKAKEYIRKKRKELQENLWFYKVWEFGKEDYIDMGLVVE